VGDLRRFPELQRYQCSLSLSIQHRHVEPHTTISFCPRSDKGLLHHHLLYIFFCFKQGGLIDTQKVSLFCFGWGGGGGGGWEASSTLGDNRRGAQGKDSGYLFIFVIYIESTGAFGGGGGGGKSSLSLNPHIFILFGCITYTSGSRHFRVRDFFFSFISSCLFLHLQYIGWYQTTPLFLVSNRFLLRAVLWVSGD
jgi:hypothetical protein